jgi:hypothetical protein
MREIHTHLVDRFFKAVLPTLNATLTMHSPTHDERMAKALQELSKEFKLNFIKVSNCYGSGTLVALRYRSHDFV